MTQHAGRTTDRERRLHQDIATITAERDRLVAHANRLDELWAAEVARAARLEELLREAVPWIEDEGEHFPDDRTHEEGRCERCYWLHQVRAYLEALPAPASGGTVDVLRSHLAVAIEVAKRHPDEHAYAEVWRRVLNEVPAPASGGAVATLHVNAQGLMAVTTRPGYKPPPGDHPLYGAPTADDPGAASPAESRPRQPGA